MTSHVNSQLNELAGIWKLDPSRTTITVTATKLGFITVPATLALSAGTVEVDSDGQVSVTVTVDAGSYASPNAKRNEHVRGADFLDADNHSELVFRSDTVSPIVDGYQVDGSVTVKGRTSPLQVEISGVEVADGSGWFQATATVDRNAVGVDKLPSFIVGRELQLTVDAHADLVAAGG